MAAGLLLLGALAPRALGTQPTLAPRLPGCSRAPRRLRAAPPALVADDAEGWAGEAPVVVLEVRDSALGAAKMVVPATAVEVAVPAEQTIGQELPAPGLVFFPVPDGSLPENSLRSGTSISITGPALMSEAAANTSPGPVQPFVPQIPSILPELELSTPVEGFDLPTTESEGLANSDGTLVVRVAPSEAAVEMPTLRELAAFCLPSLGIWLSSPCLSLIDTSVVGVQCATSQLAALGPSTKVSSALNTSVMHTAVLLCSFSGDDMRCLSCAALRLHRILLHSAECRHNKPCCGCLRPRETCTREAYNWKLPYHFSRRWLRPHARAWGVGEACDGGDAGCK